MTLKQFEYIHWLLAALIFVIMLLTGCSSARPYTPAERKAFTHAIIGQSLDALTTDAFLSSGQMREANPVFGDTDSVVPIIASKALLLGGLYLYGQISPDSRRTMWKVMGWAGYGAATWNAYQMIDNNVTPWGDYDSH